MTASMQEQRGLTAVLAERWEQASRKVAELAEAIPANEFDARPLEGIRSLSDVLRHVAFWNQYVADTLNGKEANDAANELPIAGYSTKGSIVAELKGTAIHVATALRERQSPLDLKTTELILTFVEHTSEHYGQLVVYTRLIGIIPPASRT